MNGELAMTLKGIFGDKYSIPLYQRNFAWRADEIQLLLQDIYEALKKNSKGKYYIGSLVVLKRHNGDYEVIDGQQRLTTIFLLYKYLLDEKGWDAEKLKEDEKEKKRIKEERIRNKAEKEAQQKRLEEDRRRKEIEAEQRRRYEEELNRRQTTVVHNNQEEKGCLTLVLGPLLLGGVIVGIFSILLYGLSQTFPVKDYLLLYAILAMAFPILLYIIGKNKFDK